MLSFTTKNCDDVYVKWKFDSVATLKEVFDNDVDIPMLDDRIFECTFNGTPLYFNDFKELADTFGISLFH